MPKSHIFLILLLSFIVGVAFASFLNMSIFFGYLIFLWSLVILILGRKIEQSQKVLRFSWIIGLIGIFFLLGVVRFNLAQSEINPNQAQFYNGRQIKFIGRVIKEPDQRLKNVKLTVRARQAGERKIKGRVLITTNLYPKYNYGDELKFDCKLQKPKQFSDFDYEKYLSRYDIYSVCYYPKIEIINIDKGNLFLSSIYKIKNRARGVIKNYLAEPQASLLKAMLLGDRGTIPQDLRDKFSCAGVSHIIAISGLHITIISAILLSLLLGIGLSRKQSFYLAISFLGIYVILIGFPASAVRATSMAFMVLVAMHLGRLNRSINALVLVASLMLLINPKLLVADIGFQLSFLAVLGLIYLAPVLEKCLKKISDLAGIKSVLIMTLSAQIFTLPLIAYYFKQISLIAPLTNILILPILPGLVILGIAFLVSGMIWLPMATIFLAPVGIGLVYILKIVNLLSTWFFCKILIS